jgi:hypothetical protein
MELRTGLEGMRKIGIDPDEISGGTNEVID